jgi:hypothetical protein
MPCRAAAVHLALLLAGRATLAGGATCKFEAEVDYGSGKQTQPAGWPKDDLSKVDCCEACAKDAACMAGVLALKKEGDETGQCWHKDAVDVKAPNKPCCGKKSMGCTIESRTGRLRRGPSVIVPLQSHL